LTFKTTDGGTTWTALSTPDVANGQTTNPGAGQSWYDLYITVDPANANIAYVAGVDIAKTINGGTSWTNITNVYQAYPSPIHPDQHFMSFVKPPNGSTGPTQFYITNDGGNYTSPDGGVTWTNLNSNLATLETYVTTEGLNFANQPWPGPECRITARINILATPFGPTCSVATVALRPSIQRTSRMSTKSTYSYPSTRPLMAGSLGTQLPMVFRKRCSVAKTTTSQRRPARCSSHHSSGPERWLYDHYNLYATCRWADAQSEMESTPAGRRRRNL